MGSSQKMSVNAPVLRTAAQEYRTSVSELAYSPLRTGIERDLFSVPPPLTSDPTPSRDLILGNVRQGIQYATDPTGDEQAWIPGGSLPSRSFQARSTGALDDLYSNNFVTSKPSAGTQPTIQNGYTAQNSVVRLRRADLTPTIFAKAHDKDGRLKASRLGAVRARDSVDPYYGARSRSSHQELWGNVFFG